MFQTERGGAEEPIFPQLLAVWARALPEAGPIAQGLPEDIALDVWAPFKMFKSVQGLKSDVQR